MRRLRLWPITELGAGVAVVSVLLIGFYGGSGFLDALTGRPTADERLITAAATHDYEAFDTALADGASVKARDVMGMTALGYAAIAGDEAWLVRLLTAGAEADRENRWGITPLMFAAEYDKPAIVEILLQHGADLHRRGFDGKTAIDRARSRNARATIEVLANWKTACRQASPVEVAQSPID